MKIYTIRNVAKAAQIALDATQCSDRETIRLTLVNGMDGSLVKEKHYRTVRGLMRNSGRKVRAYFRHSPGAPWSYPIRFEATY